MSVLRIFELCNMYLVDNMYLVEMSVDGGQGH